MAASIKVADTTREDRIRIVSEALASQAASASPLAPPA